MSARSKEELQTLYFELGDALALDSQLPDAADAYAIAMYYARRTGNRSLAELCREQVLACHPNHVAGREDSAPLFLAQLLMRYPAEDAKDRLERLRAKSGSPSCSSSWTVPIADEASAGIMASAEPVPPPSPKPASVAATPTAPAKPAPTPVATAVGALNLPEYRPTAGRSDNSLASLFAAPPAPAVAPTSPSGGGRGNDPWPGIGHAGFDQHHALAPAGYAPQSMSSRAADDFEMPASDRRAARRQPSYDEGMRWLNPIAALVALAGAVAIGFFAYCLYPEVSKLEYKRAGSVIDQAMQDAVVWYQKTVDTMQGQLVVTPSEPAQPTVEMEGDLAPSWRPTEHGTTVSVPIETERLAPPTTDPLPQMSSTDPPVESPPRELPPIATEPNLLPPANSTDQKWSAPANLAGKATEGVQR